ASAYQDRPDHALGQTLAATDPVAQALAHDESTSIPGLIGDQWHLITTFPLKDGGQTYGSIVLYLDISPQIDPVLQDLAQAKLATYGQLFLLRPTTDGKDWIRVAGMFGKPGDLLSAGNPPDDFAAMNGAFQSA